MKNSHFTLDEIGNRCQQNFPRPNTTPRIHVPQQDRAHLLSMDLNFLIYQLFASASLTEKYGLHVVTASFTARLLFPL